MILNRILQDHQKHAQLQLRLRRTVRSQGIVLHGHPATLRQAGTNLYVLGPRHNQPRYRIGVEDGKITVYPMTPESRRYLPEIETAFRRWETL